MTSPARPRRWLRSASASAPPALQATGVCAIQDGPPAPFAIAATSGKGGVGKTNLITNLAVAMAEMGQRVMILDGDLGLANVDLLLGLAPRRTLHDVVTGVCRVEEIVLTAPSGIQILPASSGVEEMANLDDYRREVLLRSLEAVTRDRDVLLVDTGSGIHAQTIRLAQVGAEILVVTTPEPPAFSDAYATLKVLASRALARPPRLVVTMANDDAEAARVAQRVRRVARRFLDLDVDLCGVIPKDAAVGRAVREQRPFVSAYPDSRAAAGVRTLARRLLDAPDHPQRVTQLRSMQRLAA
jgi:flagellar biosynthesis protein FlhG